MTLYDGAACTVEHPAAFQRKRTMPLEQNSIARLDVKNLTVFPEAHFTFASGLNLIAGENGSGKTHLLKLCYCVVESCTYLGKLDKSLANAPPKKATLVTSIAQKLIGVFKPDQLGRLASRQRGRNRCEIRCDFTQLNSLQFSFNSTSKSEVTVDSVPSGWIEKQPVYLPPRELLTIAPGFVSLYETTHLEFEETYRDTCLLLGAPLARGPREARIKELLEPIEQAMGGKVEVDASGRFYLKTSSGSMEMHLVAEGLRKLAMIARLIATGQLVDKGFLFWDEPEANLNPKVVKEVAKTILHLCRNGIQVFVATHSLFLMRELDILLGNEAYSDIPARFFGLHPQNGGVEVKQGDSIDDIGEITSLQEELSQSDRYLASETS